MEIKEKIMNKEGLYILNPNQEYEKLLEDNKYNVTTVNFNDINNSNCWNPLMLPYLLYKDNKKDEALDLVKFMADCIFKENDAIDPFWGNATADLFTGLAIGLFIDGDESKIIINNIEKMVLDFANDKTILKKYIEDKGIESIVYKLASCAVYAPQDTLEGIILVFKEKIGLLTNYESINKIISNNSIDLRSIKEKENAIIIIGDTNKEYINKTISILVNQIESL